MYIRKLSVAVFAFLTVIAVWGYAQQESSHQKTDRLPSTNFQVGKQFSITPLSEQSAILLDATSGETWYLRAGSEGTIWLSIPRIDSDQREKWLEKEGAKEFRGRRSDLGT